MTKLSYWEKRHLRVKQRAIKNAQAYEKALQPGLNGAYREIAKEASSWVDKYAANEGLSSDQAIKALAGIKTKHWQNTLAQFEAKAKAGGYEQELNSEYYKSRLARLSELEEQMRKLTRGLAKKHAASMETALTKQYQDTYMQTTFSIQQQRGFFTSNFAHFNEDQLKTVVSRPWAKDGKDFSQRIWKNYQQELPSYLMDSLFRVTVMGWGVDKVAQRMHAQFQDIKRNQIHNLVQSELGHIQEEATAKSYEESGIDAYEYMATLESHTCDVCAKLDGQHFAMKDRRVGINYPLIHARCRCTTVPWIADLPDVGERWMRDPETGKGKQIKDVRFPEWQAMIKRNQQRLTLEEEGAIKRYISSDSYILNDTLRRQIPLNSQQQAWTIALDKALDKMPKYIGSKPLYRSYEFYNQEDLMTFLANKKVNTTFADLGYFSTSKQVYNEADTLRMLIVRSHSGADLKDFNDAEKEVLFKRNVKFKIISQYLLNGKPIMEVEEVE